MSVGTRLDRLLANLGYGSRREIAKLVKMGRVTLDGQVVATPDMKLLDAEARRLRIAGRKIDPLHGVVLMMHKPIGMTCSHDEAGPLIYDLLPDRWRRRTPPISSVGRLDKETSGLLLMTDDGVLLHKIIAPKSKLPKRYRAQLARPLRGAEAALLTAGTMVLDGESRPLLPATLELLDGTSVMLTITEGRYHQVRRMFAAVGNHVEALHRESIGGLMLLDDLQPGDYRILDAAVVDAIFAPQPAGASSEPPL